MGELCLSAEWWAASVAVVAVNGCFLISLLISGAQRMRSAMGAQGRLPQNQGQGQSGEAQPCGATGGASGGEPPAQGVEGDVMQVKSRQGTVDFSEEVQTILDTGEIKLVKAMQKTTETQTDFTPVWFFGFDPTANQPAATVTTPEGSVVPAEEPAVRDIPAVDLSRFEQFSVIHYSDTRNPDKRKLVMIQTPGSKMYTPEELCSENLSVQNKPTLDIPQSSRRQLFDRKTKSMDNGILTSRGSSSGQDHSVLKRQERVVEGKMESGDEGSHDGDMSLRDPDIDSGIWDMVHGRDTRLSSRDVMTPMTSPNIKKEQQSTGDNTDEKTHTLESTGKENNGACAEEGGEEAEEEQEGAAEESGTTWQEMYEQMAVSDSDRPTMSYRVFHIQDQVALDGDSTSDPIRLESPMSDRSSSPQPVQASTPRSKVRIVGPEEQEVEGETGREDHDSDLGTELRSNDSTVDDVFSDELFAGNSGEAVEDSGWLFDKIPAMQGSLIHSPSSPSSPKPFPQVDSSNNDVTPVVDTHDVDVNDDVTPTDVEGETLTAKQIVPLEGGVVAAGSDVTDRLEAPSHPELHNRDSVESTDTLTEERVEDMMVQQEEPSLYTEGRLPAAEEAEVCSEGVELEEAVGLDGTPHPARSALFDEQQDVAGAELGVTAEADKEHVLVGLATRAGGRKPSELSSPSSGTAEEVSVVEVSQATSASNGDVYESCEEGPVIDEDTASGVTAATSTVQESMVQESIQKVTHCGLASQPSPLQSPTAPCSQLQSPLSKPTSPLARTFAASGAGSTFPPERGCVVHRSGARPKRLSQTLSPRRGQQAMGLQSILSEESGTLINGQAERRASAGYQSNPDDVYLVNRDGTLTNASSGVVYRSGARPKSSSVSGMGMMGRGGAGGGGGGDFGLQGLNSLMVRSTSSCVVHSHVITELTAARSRLNVPELRRTPDRHSVASSDSEYASVESSLATSPTSTSVEELASVGSDTCLLAEVMPVANYQDWMSNLPKRLHAVPLTHLAIPGSNVSFAIESDMRTDMSFSKCNLEMAEFLRKLPPLAVFDNFRKIMKDIWRAWMPKQILSITKQLEAGVRYLDIHITRYRGTFYGEHGLYTRSLKHYLRHVDEFIQQHPREVIILHFQTFVNLSPKDKRSLVTLLFQFFGAKLCRVMDTANLTLEELWASKKQILAIFPDADMPALSNHIFAGLIWSNKVVRSSLPRKQTTPELVTYLESVYDEQREPDEFHVLQAVVSPDMDMVFGDYVHKSMRSLTLCETSPYLKVWLPGKANLNIVSVDFVGIYDLTGEIIRLNENKKAVTVV